MAEAEDRPVLEFINRNILTPLFGYALTGDKLVEETVHASDDIRLGDQPNEDVVIEKKGIEGYRAMLRDAEVAAAMDIRLALMIPGLHMVPGDPSEEGVKAAQFCDGVLNAMQGDLLGVIREQMLRESITTGFSISEPVEQMIVLPDFGEVIGLKTIKTAASESFTDYIKTDEFGNIIQFDQMTTGGTITIEPEKVIYYAFKGTSWNPYGTSILHAAWDPWFLKQQLFRLYAVFATVNASGVRIGTIKEDKEYKAQAAGYLDKLKKLGEYASIILPGGYDLKMEFPPGTAGAHFYRGIKELCNTEIKKAILYDEAYNASNEQRGGYSSMVVSQENVQETLAAQGFAFAESLDEQLLRRILDRNGFTTWPTPHLIPEPEAKRDADPVPALNALADAFQKGFLTVPMPEAVQGELIQRVLRPIGVDFDITEAQPAQKVDAAERDDEVTTWQARPAGRQRSDVQRQGKDWRTLEDASTAALDEIWTESIPDILSSLNSSLFKGGKNPSWKTQNPADLRTAAAKASRVDGKQLNEGMTDSLEAGQKLGSGHAREMLSIEAAAAATSPVIVTPRLARQVLKQRVFLIMQDHFTGIETRIYNILENALMGGIAPATAIAQVEEILRKTGFSEGSRATTIVRTELAKAYNEGRMAVFGTQQDDTGPLGIAGYHFDELLDKRTTDICRPDGGDSFSAGYGGKNFRSDDPSLPQPPMHFNCRSMLVPIFNAEADDVTWQTLAESLALSSIVPTGFGGV